MNEIPEENLYTRQENSGIAPEEPKKKSHSGLIFGASALAAALIAVAVLFLLSYFSSNAKFNRAMKDKDYAKAEEILSESELKASKINDANYLALADYYLDNFNKGKDDYETAVRKLIDLKSAEVFDNKTADKIADREKTVIGSYIEEIYDSYNEKKIDYDTAVRKIGESNPFGEEIAEDIIDEYTAKAAERRESLYAETVAMIYELENGTAPDEIIEAFGAFGDFRNSGTLTGILNEIKEGNGFEAAKLLLDYRELIAGSDDVNDAEASNGVFETLKEYILDNCFESDSSSDKDKLNVRLGSDYTEMLFGDDSGKKTSLCGSESSRSLSLGKELELDWFDGCKGGTGKVLYLAHYLSDSSYEPYDMFYYYRYENLKDVPQSKMPESLEDVEYLVVYDEGGTFYADYSTNDGVKVEVYQRTIQVTVRQFPSGKTVYDSGVLTGPTPPDSLTVSTGTKFAYGEDPDLSAVTAKVKQTVGLE